MQTEQPAQDRLSAVVTALNHLMDAAVAQQRAGYYPAARNAYGEILRIAPNYVSAWHHLGLVDHLEGRHEYAAVNIEKAIRLKPDEAYLHADLATVRRALGQLDAAAASARHALKLQPNLAAAYCTLGNIFRDQDAHSESLAAYLEACRLDPQSVTAHVNAANALLSLKRYDDAFMLCGAFVAREPQAASAHFCFGDVLRALSRTTEAIAAYQRAIALQPDYAEAYSRLGHLLLRNGAVHDAIAACTKAIALNPRLVQALLDLGAAYEILDRHEESIEAYEAARALSDDAGIKVQLYVQKRAICDWANIEDAEHGLIDAVHHSNDPLPPFAFVYMECSPAEQLIVAQRWAHRLDGMQRFAHTRPAEPKKKLRIGYLSGDFHQHATAVLTAELFERHKGDFEIVAYSFGIDDRSAMRERLKAAFDGFIDVGQMDARAAADRIHADKIDILVDLKGFSQSGRPEILAQRPAPIQVTYLVYPGTMGANFIDYIIGDPLLTPMEHQPFYAERIIQLPDCYQPNDSRRAIPDEFGSRADHGLPEDAFVFCCFNNSYKITPHIFATWMRLLQKVPRSVLWLIADNAQANANLQKTARTHGIDPARLIFAPRLPHDAHLARHRCADLFLDCFPCNAHTTASDALWAGLPLLTLMGETFASRVAASLLNAIGAPELVASSIEDYEAKALHLATAPLTLADLRRRIAANRQTHPLYDTQRYARHLESAYKRMWQIWSDGTPPRPFAVIPP